MILRGTGRLIQEDLRSAGERPLAKRRGPLLDVRDGRGSLAFVNRRREAALRIASEQGTVTRRALARACGISGETARQELAALTKLGYLRRVDDGRSTEYVLR
jgi:predicted HTH transcriptional regulator